MSLIVKEEGDWDGKVVVRLKGGGSRRFEQGLSPKYRGEEISR